MQSSLAPRLRGLRELEMLHGVGDVDLTAFNPGRSEYLIQQLTCRSNKRMTFDVFLIARLLGLAPFRRNGLAC